MHRLSTILLLLSSFSAASFVHAAAPQTATSSPSTQQPGSSAPATPKAVSAPAGTSSKGATSQAAATEKPTSAQVLKLLELLRVRDGLQTTLDTMKQQMKGDAEQVFREKIPNPSPAQLKLVNGIVDEGFAELSLDDLIKDLVPIYQRHLTRNDVQALVTFYSSPPGQKILRVQPAILRESMQSAGSGQRKRMELMLAKVELRMQQLIEQESKTAPEKK